MYTLEKLVFTTECTFEERASSKNADKTYKCLVVNFPNTNYKKVVFLDELESITLEEKLKVNNNPKH